MKNCQSSDLDTEKRKEELAQYEVGKSLTFGSYYQNDESTKTPIEWIALAIEGNKVLLISKYALDCKQYNTTYENVTWETCTLRKWLNNEFLNTAFNEKEKEKIFEATIRNEKNPQFETNGGNDTKDKVFLLSIDEVYKYSNFKDGTCKPTAYAISMGAYVYKESGKYNGNGWWWLRSPGSYQLFAAYVGHDGRVIAGGSCVDFTDGGVRPALWINLDL